MEEARTDLPERVEGAAKGPSWVAVSPRQLREPRRRHGGREDGRLVEDVRQLQHGGRIRHGSGRRQQSCARVYPVVHCLKAPSAEHRVGPREAGFLEGGAFLVESGQRDAEADPAENAAEQAALESFVGEAVLLRRRRHGGGGRGGAGRVEQGRAMPTCARPRSGRSASFTRTTASTSR